jgi:hypothetical protein
MVAFGNPVPQAVIRPMGSPLIVGSFRVVCDFACHMARSNPIPGIDIGDGTCGKPVLAMKAGKVSYIRPGTVGATTSDKASIVRIEHGVLSDGADYESGYGHLAIRAGLTVDQVVPEGYQLGTVDKIGATTCHLHGGMKRNGVEIDWWPLLRQNGATEDDQMIPIPPGKFLELVNKQTSVIVDKANLRAERLLPPDPRGTVLAAYPKGTVFHPNLQADDGSPAGGATPTRWYYGPALDSRGYQIVGWMHSSVVGPLTDIVPAGGHTDAELMAAAALARANGISDAALAAAAVK